MAVDAPILLTSGSNAFSADIVLDAVDIPDGSSCRVQIFNDATSNANTVSDSSGLTWTETPFTSADQRTREFTTTGDSGSSAAVITVTHTGPTGVDVINTGNASVTPVSGQVAEIVSSGGANKSMSLPSSITAGNIILGWIGHTAPRATTSDDIELTTFDIGTTATFASSYATSGADLGWGHSGVTSAARCMELEEAGGGPITSTGDLASGDSSLDGIAKVIVIASGNLQSGDSSLDGNANLEAVDASGNLQSADSSLDGNANVIVKPSGDLESGNSSLSGAANVIIIASGNLQSGESSLDGVANLLAEIISNTDPVLDASTGNALVVDNFPSDINDVKLVSGSNETDGLNLSGTGDNYTWDAPDIAALSSDTLGCPFTTASHSVVVRATDGTESADIGVDYNPGADFAVVEALNATTDQGSAYENFSSAPLDGSQCLFTTLFGTNIDPDGTLTTDAVDDFNAILWDIEDGTFKPFPVLIPRFGSGDLQSGDSSLDGTANILINPSGNLQSADSQIDGAANVLVDTNGNLESGDSNLNGVANVLVPTSGNLQSEESSIDGLANIILAPVSGNLQSNDSQLSGNAKVIITATGNLQSGDSQINGLAGLEGIIASTGNLQSGDSDLDGAANLIVKPSGDLVSGNSLLDGTAKVIVTAFGNLQSGDSSLDGVASSGDLRTASGNLDSGNSSLDGTAKVIVNPFGDLTSQNSKIDGIAKVIVIASGNLQSGDSQLSGISGADQILTPAIRRGTAPTSNRRAAALTSDRRGSAEE